MRAIIVDDETLMLKKFTRLSEGISDINIVGQFESAEKALKFASNNQFEAAFLDVAMPITNGIELAKKLRKINPDTIIVFISAYDEYLWDFNQIGGDYYIIKPYNKNTLEMAMEKIRLLLQRQQKDIYIQTFGRFLVLKMENPLPCREKQKKFWRLLLQNEVKRLATKKFTTQFGKTDLTAMLK